MDYLVNESDLDLGVVNRLVENGVRSVNVMPTMSYGEWLLMNHREWEDDEQEENDTKIIQLYPDKK